MKLNIGCGHTHNEGYVNIDANPEVKPDLIHNICISELPYGPGSVEEVTMFHVVEHLPRSHHPIAFGEINRVLQKGGTLIISYPNAEKTLKHALNNFLGKRTTYWEAAILGRGNSAWDLHRCLMFDTDFVAFLSEYGFGAFKVIEEVNLPHNTIIQATKKFSTVERTELLRREVLKDATL